MARMRVLKPELPGHEKLAKVSRDARLLFVWIITDCDDQGRFMASPKRLAGALFPYDDDVEASDVDRWLVELRSVGLVETWEFDGGKFGCLPAWKKHQNPSHPSPSRIPDPVTSENESLPNGSGNIPEERTKDSGGPPEDGGNIRASSSSFPSSLNPSPPSGFTTHERPTADGGGGFLPETKAAIAMLAGLEADASTFPIGNRSAWLKAVCQRISDERGEELQAAVTRLQDLGRSVDASSVGVEAERHCNVSKRLVGAASWGASRAPLAFIEVRDIAEAQWPDTPELVAAALEAWEDTQRAQPATVEDVA